MKKKWTDEEIRDWIEAQTGLDRWYQTIQLPNGTLIGGTVNSLERLSLLNLGEDLSNKSVLDIGCNSGMLSLECKKRGADRVVGIDMRENRLEQARTLAEIMELDIDFRKMDLFQADILGEFDIVFCIAVLTEVTDLIGGLEVLRKVTKDTLFLEIATMETFSKNPAFGWKNFKTFSDSVLKATFGRYTKENPNNEFRGSARLRKRSSRFEEGWALVPDREFLDAIMSDDFLIYDLGQSVRYNLFKMVKI